MNYPEGYEDAFQWSRAVRAYGRALSSGHDRNSPSLLESIGRCHFHSAMQAVSRSLFRARIQKAIRAYRIAESRVEENPSQALRCRAWQSFLHFWLATNPTEKKRCLDRAFLLTEKALSGLWSENRAVEYARTFDELSFPYAIGFDYDWPAAKRAEKLRLGVEHCRRIVQTLDEKTEKGLFARTCARLALFIDEQGDRGFEARKREELDREGIESWSKAVTLDRRAALLAFGYPPSGFFRILDEAEGIKVCADALEVARDARDNFAMGWLLDQTAGREFFAAMKTANPAENFRIARRSLRLAEQAERKHQLTNFVTPNDGVIWSGAPYAEHFLELSWFTFNPAERRLYLEKALRETPRLIKLARMSGFPRIVAYSHRVTAGILHDLALAEPRRELKVEFLRRALRHRSLVSRINERIHPDALWDKATNLRHMADDKARLAECLETTKGKLSLLRAAVNDKEKGLQLASAYAENVSRGKPHFIHSMVGRYCLEFGDILNSLFAVTNDDSVLRKAADAYSRGSEWFEKTQFWRNLGLLYWKTAEAYDRLQAFTAAAENFEQAAKAYRAQSEKATGPLVSLYSEYARYLEAWKNIEMARLSHRRLSYGEASKLYENAANLHDSTARWGFLSAYYRALGKLEQAEEDSKQGRYAESISTLKAASDLFRESDATLQRHAAVVERPDEKAMVESLTVGSRSDYCLARILLEEARVNEDQGDYHSSAEKYGRVAEKLLQISTTAAQPQEKREILFLSSLSRGWHGIVRSQFEESASWLKNASEQFDRSLAYTSDDKMKALATAYKYLCLGIYSTNLFGVTLDQRHYEEASRCLTLAVNNFASSDLPGPSAHAQACKLLLDAHAEIAKSNLETDVQRRTVSLGLARTMLRQAAETFVKVRKGARAEEILRLSRSLGEQVELSARVLQFSKFASNISTLIVFPGSVGGHGEAAVGHSRFAEADAETHYEIQEGQGNQSNTVSIKIQIANTGNESIRLVRIENAIPQGARMVEGPKGSKLYGQSLSLKAVTLGQLAVETLEVVVSRGKKQAPLVFRPRVVFLGERGAEKHRELPTRVFGSSSILDFLTGAFLEDYMQKRLSIEHSGWRTMSTIASTLRIPRSQLYGEPRWGHAYGPHLERLLKTNLVESRIFPGERGRGAQIRKIRVAYDNEHVRAYVEAALKRDSREFPSNIS